MPRAAQTFKAFAKTLELDNGKPLRVEPFQERFVADVDAEFPECWWLLPEGNGKTTALAAFILYHLQKKEYASVPVAASTRDQAMVLYRQAKGMIMRSGLSDRYLCQDGTRRILYGAKGIRYGQAATSIAQIFAADAGAGDGIIPTLAVIDEPHRQKNMELYLTWSGKLGKRAGQLVIISTAGEPGSEFEEMREAIRRASQDVERDECFARYVHEGIVLHEWAVPADADVEDLELVKQANPLSTITVKTLRDKRNHSTMTLDHWRRFSCNQPTRGDNAAISEIEWENAKGEGIPPGESIWLGVDPALKWDSMALVPYWQGSDEDRRLGPATILEPRSSEMIPRWKIEHAIAEIHHEWPIHTVVLDSLTAAGADIVREVCEDSLGIPVLERGTGLPAQVLDFTRFMEALRKGWLTHSGDPGLTRHALNAIARRLPRGDYVFERPVSSRSAKDQSRRRIDALDAAALVHGAASVHETSVYDTRGVLEV